MKPHRNQVGATYESYRHHAGIGVYRDRIGIIYGSIYYIYHIVGFTGHHIVSFTGNLIVGYTGNHIVSYTGNHIVGYTGNPISSNKNTKTFGADILATSWPQDC